jgi:hypothetical protein
LRPRAYVAGPYTAKTVDKRDANIRTADAAGRDLLALGYAPIVPHNNTAAWELDSRFAHDDFLEADFSLLAVCSLVVVVGDWQHSAGTKQEIEFATRNGIPIFYGTDAVPPAIDFPLDTTTKACHLLIHQRQKGVKAYGSPLKPRMPQYRDWIYEAQCEAADMLTYLTQAVEEEPYDL